MEKAEEKVEPLLNLFVNIWSKLASWKKGNRREAVVILLVLLLAAFLRLYKIDQYMTFLGDEGRDAIVVRKLLVDFDPILIGPRTSVGDMYLGPLYYYLIAPALFLGNYSPVGPSIQIALFGVLTVAFVWLIAREWFKSPLIGILVAFLYSISPTVIIHSRSSWNPNIMPFFALLVMFCLWKVWKKKEYIWLVVLGLAYAFVLQSHYLGLLLAPSIGFFWILTLKEKWDNKKERGVFFRNSVVGLLLFVLLMSPLVVFDARHGWRNFSSMNRFFTEQSSVSAQPINAIMNIWPVWENIVTRLIAGRSEIWGFWIAILIILVSLYFFIKSKLTKTKVNSKAYLLIFVWLLIGVVGLSLYQHEVFDHYFGFLFPVMFLLIGALFERISRVWYGKNFILLTTLLLGFLSFRDIPLKYPPNMQMQRAKTVAELIMSESGEDRFNFAVLAERNYEDGYEYFLIKNEALVVDIDPVNTDETITKQLFVICEEPKEKCQPTTNPKAEIANFGWSKIKREWEVSGVVVYKLIHTENEL